MWYERVCCACVDQPLEPTKNNGTMTKKKYMKGDRYGTKELVKSIWEGVLHLHSWMKTHRILINLQLTGKVCLIFNSMSSSS